MTLFNLANKVGEEFHDSFGIKNQYTPGRINIEEAILRYKLMREENEEYLDAALSGDIVEIADALGDQLYILLGTLCKHGLQERILHVFNEIHESNLSKLGEDGKPILREDGKILKGPNYFKPDINKILNEGE